MLFGRSILEVCGGYMRSGGWERLASLSGVRFSGGISHGGGTCKRGFCSSKDSKGLELLYTGDLGKAIRNLKLLSITSCGATLLGAPLLLLSDSIKAEAKSGKKKANASDGGNIFKKGILTAVVIVFGVGSTALVNWGTKPYIIRLFADRSSKVFIAENMTLFGKIQRTEFKLSDVERNIKITRPFVNFRAKGRNYFVHKETFSDKALLHALVG
eukprot:Nk52_evm57s236 gene=Nk52_evmTU57s236